VATVVLDGWREECGTQRGVGRRGEQITPQEGTVLFREGEGEIDRGRQNRQMDRVDRRLDLGLQDAPRSTIYSTKAW